MSSNQQLVFLMLVGMAAWLVIVIIGSLCYNYYKRERLKRG